MIEIPYNYLAIQHGNNSENEKTMLPRFCMINARSFNQKTDVLAASMTVNKIKIATVTESWLHNNIDDDQISIDAYIIHRKDRLHGRRGGYVCTNCKEHLGIRELVLKVQIMNVCGCYCALLSCQDLCLHGLQSA